MYVLWIVACLVVLFVLAIVLSALRLTAFIYFFGILKVFFTYEMLPGIKSNI